MRNERAPVEGVSDRLDPADLSAALGAGLEVLLEGLLGLGGELSVDVESRFFYENVAAHSRSPSTVRIFLVARKRQLRAASSLVPVISPILINRMPW